MAAGPRGPRSCWLRQMCPAVEVDGPAAEVEVAATWGAVPMVAGVPLPATMVGPSAVGLRLLLLLLLLWKRLSSVDAATSPPVTACPGALPASC